MIAPGCPAFGDDSVFARPLRADRDARSSVAPGRHAARAGAHPVVWWDPRALELDRQPEGGLRQQRILAADERGQVSMQGILEHAAWADRRRELLAKGATPSVPARTATEIAEEASQFSAGEVSAFVADVPRPEIDFEETAVERAGRPRGKRFGILVHAVMAEVDLFAGEAEIATAAAAQGRLLGSPREEIEAAAKSVVAALAHPLMRRAAEAALRGECRRESPVLLPMSDGTVIEGVVDLAFREPGIDGPEWVVVDFKTDHELAAAEARYRAQLQQYVNAVTRATGRAASGVLFRV
jgi:ATP-dependent exoDNAse (exonuclease V) beta subunit